MIVEMIVNYIRFICQMKSTNLVLLLSLFFGCSASINKKEGPILAKPNWFKAPKHYRFLDREGHYQAHAFFDLAPFPGKNDNGINVFITTPEGSAFRYDLDLLSGKRFKVYRYCEQKDVWDKYKGRIARPPYALGIVPRLLGHDGRPQKVLVYGKRRYLREGRPGDVFSQRVKVIGGIVRQYCEKFPCHQARKWQSSLLLIAVSRKDPALKSVENLADLKKIVNWPESLAFLENGDGRQLTKFISEPAYRNLGEVDGKEALKYVMSKGHLFDFKRMNKMRAGCYKLYDYLWSHSSQMYKQGGKPVDLKGSQKSMGEKEKSYRDFTHFFNQFSQKYGQRFQTCSRFVRPANLRDGHERFWFFAMVQNYFNLEKLGYHYFCNKNGWIENPLQANGTRFYTQKDRGVCNNKSLNLAFDRGIATMAALRTSARESYTFVEYDDGLGGSQEKIYSWVHFDNKKLKCEGNRKEKNLWQRPIFPHDISWNQLKFKAARKSHD